MKFFRKSAQQEYNLLELTPQRTRDYEIDDEGLVTIKLPRFKSEALRVLLVPRWKRPHVHLRLDRIGSFVWKQCDGGCTVNVIAERMKEQFGEDAEPVHERLRVFLQQLHRSTWITLHTADGANIDD
jgi:hypothetical protein